MFNWTEQVTAQLQALWADGLSTAKIGKAIGTTKNSVVSKARRLNLPMRQPARTISNTGVKQYRAPRIPLREMKSIAYGTPKQMIELEHDDCRWPIGTPKTDGFHFCGAKTDAYPYCPNHQAVAYTRMRKAR